MNLENENKEQFSFHVGKIKFDSKQPGKETRKTLAPVGIIIILLLIVITVACYFLKANLTTAGIIGGGTLIRTWVVKGNRSP